MTGRAFFATVQASFAITPGADLPGGRADAQRRHGRSPPARSWRSRRCRPGCRCRCCSSCGSRLDVQTSLALFRRIFEYLDLEPAITERPGATAPRRIRAAGRDRVQRRLVPVPRAARAHRHGQPGPLRRHRRPDREPGRRDDGAGRRGWALRGRLVQGRSPASSRPSSGRPAPGKTTMTYLVPRFYDVTEGAVLIDGHDVRDLTLGSVVRGGRHGDAGAVPVPRHDPRQHRLRQARTPPRPRSSRPPATRTSTTASSASPTATRRSPASAATGCPAARSSGWRSPGCC